MSDGRIEARFRTLATQHRAAFITFITAGDPDPETSAEILVNLPAAGADIIELGMPFTDPMADGPTIQESSGRALAAGMTVAKTLDLVRAFRTQDNETPIVLMGYFNPVHHYGIDAFINDAVTAGVDGMILVDLPPEEDEAFRVPASKAGLSLIRLATPTTDAARMPRVLAGASGFVYYVSVAGITGDKAARAESVADAVQQLRDAGGLPVAVGFGIRTSEQAEEIASVADGVVVGSAIVQKIKDNLDVDGTAKPGLIDKVADFVRELASGVHR